MSRARARSRSGLLLVLALALAGCSTGAARTPAPASAAAGWTPDAQDEPLEPALARAARRGRPLLLLFVTEGCGYCRWLEQQTLPDARVRRHLAGFEVVRYDAARQPGRELVRRYGVQGFPSWVRVDASGGRQALLEGYDEPGPLLERLRR